MRVLFLFFWISLFSADFDCVIVGTSPFSLFEALYQKYLGKRVLILEEDSICGGAWKSIDVCGVSHADLGCHQIGSNLQLKTFLEEYAGCKMVSLENPNLPFEQKNNRIGWYFSQGCFELVDHLLRLIDLAGIEVRTHCKLENATVDLPQKIAYLQTTQNSFTTEKLIVTPMSCVCLGPSHSQTIQKSKHYHLYLLIQDETSPQFSYKGGLGRGISRAMNLTHFVGLAETGRQLIVIQTHAEENLKEENAFLEMLKQQKLLAPHAYILQSEICIYESGSLNQSAIAQIGAQGIIEVLQTGHFQNLANYIPKWKQVLKPYWEIVRN